jgi:hypothetical protein
MPVSIFFKQFHMHERKILPFGNIERESGEKDSTCTKLEEKQGVPSIMLDLAPSLTSDTGSCTTGCLRIVFLDLFH